MNKILSAFWGLPKTLWLNFYCLPVCQAIHLPIILAGNVRFRNLQFRRMKITGAKSVKMGMIRIGFHNVEPVDTYSSHTILCIERNGLIIFNGSAHIGRGAILHISGGSLYLGDNFAISGTTSIVCKNEIRIGKDVQFSYNGLVIDSDAHHIIDENGVEYKNTDTIVVGNRVWIAPNVTLQKGCQISDNSVVASNSLVNKKFQESGILLGGIPAKKIRRIKGWKL